MTVKELKKLSKLELVDILIAQDEEIEELQNKIADLKDQLKRSNDVIDNVIAKKTGLSGMQWRDRDENK